MAQLRIGQKVRPIKFGFVVDLTDKESILKAIEINTLLWGGNYNPIIPFFKNVPNKIFDPLSKHKNNRSIVKSYLDAFDPDFVIPIGEKIPKDLDFGQRPSVSIGEFFHKDGLPNIPKYGLSVFEVL